MFLGSIQQQKITPTAGALLLSSYCVTPSELLPHQSWFQLMSRGESTASFLSEERTCGCQCLASCVSQVSPELAFAAASALSIQKMRNQIRVSCWTVSFDDKHFLNIKHRRLPSRSLSGAAAALLITTAHSALSRPSLARR